MTAVALARRGTSNGNARGSTEDRRRRRVWLVQTYRANVDVLDAETRYPNGIAPIGWYSVAPIGLGIPACRCYRCGALLTDASITVDRIIPGCMGGTYRRSNIRPACGPCNESTGGALATLKKKRRKK